MKDYFFGYILRIGEKVENSPLAFGTSRHFGNPHGPLAGQEPFYAGRREQSILEGAGRAKSSGALLGTKVCSDTVGGLAAWQALWP